MEGFYSQDNDVSRQPAPPWRSTVKSQESLPSSQSGLVFQSSKWDDSHLASSLLFLDKFCRNVSAKKFKEQVTNRRLCEDVKAICRDCMLRLKFLSHYFIPTYGPGAVAGRKIHQIFYEGKLKPEKFDDYIHWLVKNIPAIKKSVMNMNNEVFTHSQTVLKTETSVGPLKYGFAYMGDKWKQLHDWSSGEDFYSLLTFSLSLEKLQHCLEKVLKSSPRRSTVVSSVDGNPEEPSVEPRSDIPTQFEDLVEDSKRLHANSDISKDSTSEDNEDKSSETTEDV